MVYNQNRKIALSDIVRVVRPLKKDSDPKMFLKILSECRNATTERSINKPSKIRNK